MEQIYIVIPVYNRKNLVRECLSSLHQQTTSHYEIIVVDDGSTDGTSAMIQEAFPKVTILNGDGTLWWTGAINKAVQYVLDICQPEDCILLLNDDLIVPTNYISTFFDLITRFPDTLIGSVVSTINKPSSIYSGGIYINWYTGKMRNLNVGQQLANFPQGFHIEVSTLTGRGVLIPSKVFRKIGLHNQKHLPQHGDTEFPVRAKRAGFPTIVSYDAVVYSHIDDKNDLNVARNYKLSDFKQYLMSKKSHCNIYDRFWFAYHTRVNLWQFMLFFVFDLLRVIGSFVRKTDFIERFMLRQTKIESRPLDTHSQTVKAAD